MGTRLDDLICLRILRCASEMTAAKGGRQRHGHRCFHVAPSLPSRVASPLAAAVKAARRQPRTTRGPRSSRRCRWGRPQLTTTRLATTREARPPRKATAEDEAGHRARRVSLMNFETSRCRHGEAEKKSNTSLPSLFQRLLNKWIPSDGPGARAPASSFCNCGRVSVVSCCLLELSFVILFQTAICLPAPSNWLSEHSIPRCSYR